MVQLEFRRFIFHILNQGVTLVYQHTHALTHTHVFSFGAYMEIQFELHYVHFNGRRIFISAFKRRSNKKCYIRGGVAQWVARLTPDRWIPVSREFEPQQRLVSLSKKHYPHWLVLVGSRNGFERDLHKQALLVSQSN